MVFSPVWNASVFIVGVYICFFVAFWFETGLLNVSKEAYCIDYLNDDKSAIIWLFGAISSFEEIVGTWMLASSDTISSIFRTLFI
jgi:hypothetical protein